MESATPPIISPPTRQKFALFLKIGGICFLILLLHVPLAMTDGVLRERMNYQNQATEEIGRTWGQSQSISGPVLVVPWTQIVKRTREWKNKEGNVETKEETFTNTGSMYYLPESLQVNAQLDPEIRYRGIHELVVFSAQVELNGTFQVSIPTDGAAGAVYHWERARLFFGATDLRRLRATPIAQWRGEPAIVEANNTEEAFGLGLMAAIGGTTPGDEMSFSIKLGIQGSEHFNVTPVGRQTEVTLTSSWQNPSFNGVHLPVKRDIDSAGFTATWALGPFGRNYPFLWNSKDTDVQSELSKFPASSFGVAFLQPVDGYRQAERAQKYGVLFFILVFAVFFLFEVTAPLRIHPLQYAMVGAALCLFFLGFLALSEFLATGAAYALAAAACTALISFYSLSVLKSGRRTSVIAGGLAATYGYLYFVLKSQDYALLAGTAALFAALAIVMFFTRRIDWYSLEMKTVADGAK